VISCEQLSSGIITAHFNTRLGKIVMNVIQCYAPTNEADEREKTGFYYSPPQRIKEVTWPVDYE